MFLKFFGLVALFGLASNIHIANAAEPAFVGKWAQGQDACKAGDSYTINSRGFKDDLTGDDQCSFSEIKPLSNAAWSVMAMCGTGEQIAFKLELSGNSLSISGGHQPHRWVRCAP
ncbi:MAG: hypothetical protein ACR2OJ_01620 [Hyphomicrobiales bacterium]